MLSLIVLSLLGGWQVEETPLAPAPWEVDSVTPIDGDSLGVIARIKPDAGPPEWGVFVEVEAGEVTPPQKGEPPSKVLPPAAKAKPSELPYPRELPEAVALSENEIFVMEPLEKHPYTWFRGPPKGKGLTFIVDGPSVLRFQPKGVVVESVATWRFGTSIFEESLGDDWHHIRTDEDKFALVRLTEIE